MDFSNMSSNEIESLFNALSKRSQDLARDRDRIEAALAERRRSLREVMEECRKEGLNPETLKDEIARMKEIIGAKYNILHGDIESAESIVKPMLSGLK